MKTISKVFTALVAVGLTAGCTDLSTTTAESVDRLVEAGHDVTVLEAPVESQSPEAKPAAECPDGWVDTSIIAIDCLPEAEYVEKTFKGLTCATCQLNGGGNDNDSCNGNWVPASAEIKCAEGYVETYNGSGTCKRCSKDNGGEVTSCIVTGCSGQICAEEPVATTCEYKAEYACYTSANCGAFGPGGACAWEQTEELATCIDEANSGGITTL